MLVLVDDHSRYSSTHTLPHSPQQNGVAESRIREITKIARCLLAHASTPPSLWGYALLHATLLLNLRSHPCHTATTPTELWSGTKPDAAGLRVWGCKAYVLIPPPERTHGKLASRALECVYLGHNRDSPGYLFLHPPSGRLIRSIDVVFDETTPYYSSPPPDPLPPPTRPLAWTDTVLLPLLPPAPLLPPLPTPLPPPSSADIYDPTAPASPAHSAAPSPSSPSYSPSHPSQQPQQQPQGQQQQQQQPQQQPQGQQQQPQQQQQQQPQQQPQQQQHPQQQQQQGQPQQQPQGQQQQPQQQQQQGQPQQQPQQQQQGQQQWPPQQPQGQPQQQQQQPQQRPQQQQGVQQQQQQQRRRASARSSPFLLPRMHTRSLDPILGTPPPSSLHQLEDSHEEFAMVRHHTPSIFTLYPDLFGALILSAISAPTIFVPTTFQEAITCPDADKWLAAIFLECEAFIRNDSFIDVPLPPDANLVEGKWIFRVKQLPGEEPVYKARYVAKGFTQTWAEDYWFTFAPTLRQATLRTLMDIGARDDMEIDSMDVSNAFLQGELHERIFLRRPPGFHAAFPENTVWQLKRPVYGLKQAPREWHAKLSATLQSLGFSPSHSDASLFIRSSPSRFFISVYVDDMILLADTRADMDHVKRSLQERLKCKDLGPLQNYLGMAITRDRSARTITLSQSHYIGQVLEKFEMAQAKPVSTPLPFGHQLAPPTSPSTSSRPYAELVGSLMYAMMCTRPDLAYPVSVLARFVGPGRHTEEHWTAAKRVLRYLRGTRDHALTLGGSSPPLLSGFSDSSWADCQPDRRSSQGYGFTLGSGLISWRSTRSSAIALSSCEAELYAGTMAAQESRWLCFLLAELGVPQRCPTLWCDNASTIHLTQDPVFHGRSKHIELRYFFIRELVQQNLIAVRKIAAEANLADIFTKALLRPAHSALLRLIGLAPPGAP
ncbi:unnamed protein product [Closterium sp. Yama58-4]|nr:unnamed protein product [Closterium sp. Yama58-4]